MKIVKKRFTHLSNLGQGTIEYLVIIGIIVVISLVVVSLVIQNSESAPSTSQTSSTIFSSIGSGGISVTDAISDYDGTGIINLSNYSGEARSLTKIITDEGENEYNDKLIGDDGIDISGLCNCEEGMKSKTCNFKFYFKEILNPIDIHVTVKCEDDFEPKEPPTLPTDCFNPNKNPIPICSLTDLNQIRTNLNGNYILMKNIDASETRIWNNNLGWDPIGNSENPFNTPFTGTFDGQGKTISNLYSANSDHFVGLFSYTENATISNLKLLNIQMGGTNWIGGLVGAGAFTTIDEVEVSGLVGGSVDVGGIAGNLAGSTISNCYNHATVGGGADTPAGGIVGNFSGNIINSYNTGTIHGYTNVGGIAGEFAGEIINSYNTGTIIGDSSKIGGIVGYTLNQSNITNSYSTGNVTGDSYVGGLIGDGSWSTISNSYSNSPVQGNTSVGGLIGLANYAVITNTYSTGSVTGTENIGGLIGERDLTDIYNSFSVGEISGETTLGGLIGKGIYGTLENVYWHNSNNNCCGNGACDNCLKETNNSNFFLHNGSTHAVYYNSPIWTDGNWIWSESNYPKLYWE